MINTVFNLSIGIGSSASTTAVFQFSNRLLMNFLVTVKAVPHECVIRTGLP